MLHFPSEWHIFIMHQDLSDYPLRADTQWMHQAGVSLSDQRGGGGCGGAGGVLPGGGCSGGGGGGNGQRHGAGLLLHPLDPAGWDTMADITPSPIFTVLILCGCVTHWAMMESMSLAGREIL